MKNNTIKYAFCLLVIVLIIISIVFGVHTYENSKTIYMETPVVEVVNTEPEATEQQGELILEEIIEETVYTSAAVNMRTEPSMSGAIVKVLKTNTELTRIGQENGWSKIKWSETETYYVNNKYVSKEKTTIKKTQPVQQTTVQTTTSQEEPKDTFVGRIAHYGPDCGGCGGTTAAGYNVRNTIYYNDPTYGQVRIVAMGKTYPLYTIIKIDNYKQGSITAIVLDRGGAITGNKIDLLVSSESQASKLGIQTDAQVQILRWGK